MELNQLAFVLEYIDSSIHDTSLLATYDQLIEALAVVAGGDEAALPSVHEARDLWVTVQRHLEPNGWTHEQLAILETYNAQVLFGELAIGRLLDAFVIHFMDAKAVLKAVEMLRAETKQVANDVAVLLKGLDPVLTNASAVAQAVNGELVEDNRLRPKRTGVIDTLRERLNLPARRETAIIPANEQGMPLAAKVAAATPVILAAASKAVELYRVYQQLKQNPNSSSAPQPTPTAAHQPPTVNNFIRYTYRQTTVLVQDKK